MAELEKTINNNWKEEVKKLTNEEKRKLGFIIKRKKLVIYDYNYNQENYIIYDKTYSSLSFLRKEAKKYNLEIISQKRYGINTFNLFCENKENYKHFMIILNKWDGKEGK